MSRSADERSAGRVIAHRWLVTPTDQQHPPLAAPIALVAASRELYVLELLPAEVRRYDRASGSFLGRLGGPGEGPGEYRYPTSLAVSSAGVVAVLTMSGRLTLWAGEEPQVLSVGRGMGTAVVAGANGELIVKSDVYPPADVSEYYRVVDGSIEREPFFRDRELPLASDGGLRTHGYAVAATPAGQLLIGLPGPEYAIVRVGADGEIAETIRRPEVPPLELGAHDLRELRKKLGRAFRASGRRAPTGFRPPRYRSHIARMAAAEDGSIWVLTQRGTGDASVIDVFDVAGSLLQSFELELEAIDLAVLGDCIYVLAQSEMGIPGVAVAARPYVPVVSE